MLGSEDASKSHAASKISEREAARSLRRSTANPLLKLVLGKFIGGELESPEFQNELISVINEQFSQRGERGFAILLRQSTENMALKRILGLYISGELESPEVQGRVVAASQTEESVTEGVQRLYSRLSEAPLPQFVLGKYLAGELESPKLQNALIDVINEQVSQRGTSSLAKLLLEGTEDIALKRILVLYLSGQLGSPELQNGLIAVINEQASQHGGATIAKLLRQTTENMALKRILSLYLSGQLESPEVQGRVFAAANLEDSIAESIQHLRSQLSETLKAGDPHADVAPGISLERLRVIFKLLKSASYAADGMATSANATFLTEPEFMRSYAAGDSISVWGCDVRWRVYTLLTCAEAANKLEGDFVECGVDRGGTAMCVIRHLGAESFKTRTFHLFDTFQGISVDQYLPGEQELTRIDSSRHPPVLDEVRRTFADLRFVRIIPGIVPETLPQFTGTSIAYLHIDMNVANPERAAFEFFWPLLSKGAPVIFDDYGFRHHSKQKEVLDQAAERLGVRIMLLPTGQGLIWR